MSTRKMHAAIRDRTALHEGFLKVYRYEFEVERHAGGTDRLTREVMERGNAVAVLGHDPGRDEIVLVNEFRPGLMVSGEYPFGDNLVAGVIDGGESPLAAAVREMREETGLELREPLLIHPGAYVSSGGTSERIALVYGIVDTAGAGGIHGAPDESEDILTVVLPAQTFIDRVHAGEIADMKTLLAGYWLAARRAQSR
ncbi:MAG TPA: NUDIX domain-containing protein [Steroidobacteraceae bacterium]|nr:NUDIX domain-containing protein [Steroidobacteraceae bacterium]